MCLVPDLGGQLKVSSDAPNQATGGGAKPQLAVTSVLVISDPATTTYPLPWKQTVPSLVCVLCDVICSHMAALCVCGLLLLLNSGSGRRRKRDQLCCPVGGSHCVAVLPHDIPLRARAENHVTIKASHASWKS